MSLSLTDVELPHVVDLPNVTVAQEHMSRSVRIDRARVRAGAIKQWVAAGTFL